MTIKLGSCVDLEIGGLNLFKTGKGLESCFKDLI